MKRIAVLSDIHGNSEALRAVLADIEEQGGVDYIIALGDLVAFGPDPVGVLELIQARMPMFLVRGNTDRYLVERRYPRDNGDENWQSQLLASFEWTAQQLGEEGLQFLASLPRHQFLHFGLSHSILAVHASPRSDEEGIFVDTPDAELANMLNDFSCNLMLCAHTHIPFDRTVAETRIVNFGSVGMPFDHDTRASYGIVHLLPNGEYRVDFRRVKYDLEAVVQQLAEVAYPFARIAVYNLRTARPLANRLIYTENMRQGHAMKAVT